MLRVDVPGQGGRRVADQRGPVAPRHRTGRGRGRLEHTVEARPALERRRQSRGPPSAFFLPSFT